MAPDFLSLALKWVEKENIPYGACEYLNLEMRQTRVQIQIPTMYCVTLDELLNLSELAEVLQRLN